MDTIEYREELKRLGMDKDLADLIAHAPERLGGGGYVTRDYLDMRLDLFESKLINKIDGVANKGDGHAAKIESLETKIDGLFYRLAGLMFFMGAGYTAILFWLLNHYKP
jgi:hypothetical protein